MSANPPKNDAWKPYKHQRFVLIRRDVWSFKPWQGYVLDWRQVRRRWEAHVLYVDEGPSGSGSATLRTDWVPLDRLTPVYADPNRIDAGRDGVGRR
jgi:hypothetical protein